VKTNILSEIRQAFILLDRKAERELQYVNTPALALFSDKPGAPLPKYYYAE
jgi:hypothetical protein